MKTVWLLLLFGNDDEGTLAWVHATQMGAYAHLAALVRDGWEDVVTGLPEFPDSPPDDDQEAIDLFFESDGYNTDYAITEEEVLE